MGTPYTRGRAKEYRICDKLRREGYEIVQRSAGSHSPIDVFAISKDGQILLIQAKPENYNSKKIEEKLQWLNKNFEVRFEVW